ncbi:hypothetical protein ACFQ3Z_06555 [Streptomyces nogalater]
MAEVGHRAARRLGREHGVDRPGGQGEFGQARWLGEDDLVPGKGPADPAQCGHTGQQVTQAQRTQDQDTRGLLSGHRVGPPG